MTDDAIERPGFNHWIITGPLIAFIVLVAATQLPLPLGEPDASGAGTGEATPTGGEQAKPADQGTPTDGPKKQPSDEHDWPPGTPHWVKQ